MPRAFFQAGPIVALFMLLSAGISHAQERCGTTQYEKIRHRETVVQFEQWMQEKIRQNQIRNFQTDRTQSPTYVIPVVVHVIHNGEPIGTGTNISDAQIQSQIDVINADYNRLNADASNTPSEFLPVAGSINIQFVLARQDPDGLPANLNGNSYGIRRVKGTKTSWTLEDNATFKGLSYWPAENYLNIWVINFDSSTGLIGYAQLPVSSQLSGLETASSDRLTDGVAINYKDFGAGTSFNLDARFNKGRTATHEIGHFLGLRHIWAEDVPGCGPPGDYVDDTPPQSSSTNSCPTTALISCTPFHKMYQNYMDYTDDACMNLFTQGQISRMVVVLGNSPRRASLLTSPGATDPVPVSNDVALSDIVAPTTVVCDGAITPQITLINAGSNTVTSAQVQLNVNGSISSTIFPVTLNTYERTVISFSPISLSAGTTNQFTFQVLQVNGTSDGNSVNNQKSIQTNVPASVSLPILEPFNTVPSNWTILNPDGSITWANVTAPDNSPSNKAMYLDFYDYSLFGAVDQLVTPPFNIATPLTSQVKFDIAYAFISNQPPDNLKVYALPGCNPDLSHAVLLYDKSGSSLATTSNNGSAFVPQNNNQWKKSEVLSLSTLTPGPYQLAFVGINANGNNLYLDNVAVSDDIVNDLAITSVLSPGLVHCQINSPVTFNVKNFSTSAVTSFQVSWTINGGAAVTQTFSGIQLSVGDEGSFTISNITGMNPGSNQIKVSVLNPNGLPDSFPGNNSLTFMTYVDQTSDIAPFRKTFDAAGEPPWLSASPSAGSLWQNVSTNKGQSAVFPAFSDATIGEQSWMVSPTFSLSSFSNNSFFFDVSYAQHGTAEERLQLVASTDCGITYPTVLFDKPGSQFSSATSSNSWLPSTNTDWQRIYINLDQLSGQSNVRLAFIVTNAQGNNLYLDNLELFAGDDPNPPVSSLPYQLYYSNKNTQSDLALTFTLPSRKDVRLLIYNIVGQQVADNLLTDVLNQTYYFDFSGQSSGLYIFRLQTDDFTSTTKVFIGH
ncbi:MAG: T9SS type A sorting domain-containing protein [Bacteroidetes bacterium]|nr:T9SS type A sorting domain-containing protein [Bacteroidota bacterium]